MILPDVRGLYRFYEELALRFAERGYAAVAIDYFGRTAGVGKRDEEFPSSGPRRADDPGRHPGGRRRGRRVPALIGRRLAQRDLHGRLLLRRPQLVARRLPAGTNWPARSASTACPASATTHARPDAPRAR